MIQRLYLTYDDEDPNYAAFHRIVASIQTRGRHSPLPRTLALWALDGMQLRLGRLAPGAGQTALCPTDASTTDAIDPASVLAAQQLLDEQSAAWGSFE